MLDASNCAVNGLWESVYPEWMVIFGSSGKLRPIGDTVCVATRESMRLVEKDSTRTCVRLRHISQPRIFAIYLHI